MKSRLIPLILSAVLIAAHFLRSFDLIPMLLCLAAPFLLLIKKRWVLPVLQVLTVVSALIWMYALYGIIQERIFEGRSWIASAIILGVVAAFSLFSGWLLNSPKVRDNYL
jgi:ABC-type transport system involved in cytochrome c biogenesis permease subunit